jgi:hypothetical protein
LKVLLIIFLNKKNVLLIDKMISLCYAITLTKRGDMKILLGNAFPLSLIRNRVTIIPQTIEQLKLMLEDAELYSYWGHSNTIVAASEIVGCDITPKIARPAIRLNGAGYPEFSGITFTNCWILSPDYIDGFRPKIGEEVSPSQILGWQVLKISWGE